MDRPRLLIACVGNIFLGDDAFGVEVARRLAQCPLPEGVRVVDFGIRGLDLTYALLDGYEAVILVDAVPRGGPPGTLYVLEPEAGSAPDPAGSGVPIEAHNLDPANVLRLAAALGANVQRLILVGCEPGTTGDLEEMQSGLSDAVRAAVDEAVPLIESLVARLLQPDGEVVVCGTQVR
jgi:hydrogenase maturation protease